MIDALRLTGDSTIADDIELATLNAIAGAQHPSGEWCTYNTPINGTRVPSHVQIGFQAQARRHVPQLLLGQRSARLRHGQRMGRDARATTA